MGLFSSLFGKKKQDEPPYPSWASDSTKMQGFISTLKEKAKQRDIPEKFLGGVMTNEYSQNKLLFTAGLLEQNGASYDEQVKAVIDHVEKYWSNTDDKEMWHN
jgi:hypothetical protein